jgi:hypothetical protein
VQGRSPRNCGGSGRVVNHFFGISDTADVSIISVTSTGHSCVSLVLLENVGPVASAGHSIIDYELLDDRLATSILVSSPGNVLSVSKYGSIPENTVSRGA